MGDAVQAARVKALGTGLLLALQPEKARVFFLRIGDKVVDRDRVGLQTVAATAAEEAVLAVLRETLPRGRNRRRPRHRVYAIELSSEVRNKRAFRIRNPNMRAHLPCLYVGGTGVGPDKRFENHLVGYKSSRYASRYGLRLRRDIYGHYPAVTSRRVQVLEPAFAELLREWGYGVWQN